MANDGNAKIAEQEVGQLLAEILQTGYVKTTWPDGYSRIDKATDTIIALIQMHHKLGNEFEAATEKEYRKQQLEESLK